MEISELDPHYFERKTALTLPQQLDSPITFCTFLPSSQISDSSEDYYQNDYDKL